jgi:REP element-mobilizing transposase RayT
MPSPGKRWYHVTFSTHNSWLPGDPRGFRSRDHKIHSSGDHRNPPPNGEHEGLHVHAKMNSGDVIVLDEEQRAIAGKAIKDCLDRHGHQALVLAVGGMHVHMLVELPDVLQDAKDSIGFVKVSASMRLKTTLPGKIWARGGGFKPIRDEEHHRNTYGYILKHRDDRAWVWTFRDAEDVEGS